MLRPVPDTPPRAILYLRQSTSRDDSVSIEIQETACRDHCARHGYTVTAVESDPGISGRTWKRPAVVRVMDAIESHSADVVVLWKWSRLSRRRLDWAVALDRIEAAGGHLESATEPVDVSTSTGKFTRGMLAELAAFESDRIGDVWREVHARRTKQGLPATGRPRFGYVYVDGLHRPDPETGPVLATLYRRYLAGESIHSLARWLNDSGVWTMAGYSKIGPGPWSTQALRRMLDSGFGAGVLLVHGQHLPGAHEPVIDEAAWTAYQSARVVRRPYRRAERSPYLLSGLMRCGVALPGGEACGAGMGGGKFGGGKNPKPGFRCWRAASTGQHPDFIMDMSVVEADVMAWLAELAGKVETSTDAALAQQARATRRKQDARALGRELAATERALAKLVVDKAGDRSGMPESVWDAARDELLAERKQLVERQRLAEVEAAAGVPARIADDLLRDWDTMPVEHRRGSLRQLIRRIVVAPGRPRGMVEIVPTYPGENRT